MSRGAPWTTIGIALVAGAVVPRLPARGRLVANVATALGAVTVARRGGASVRALGLEHRAVSRGLQLGLATVVPIAAAVTASLAIPATRAFYADTRVTTATARRAAYELLVRIPVETALPEEVLFRGAVLGATATAWGTGAGVAASSIAFGVWHVLPALEARRSTPAGAELTTGAAGPVTHVAATVAVTALAGAAFAALRLRARSVAAPVVAHAAVNALAYLGARWAHASEAARAQA